MRRTAPCPTCHGTGRACAQCGAPIVDKGITTCEECKQATRAAAQARYRHCHPEYRREYKKLYERASRGTLSQDDLLEWRRANSPGSWTPYVNEGRLTQPGVAPPPNEERGPREEHHTMEP